MIFLLGCIFIPIVSADWSMFGSDPTHSGSGTGNPVLSPQMLWNFSTPGESIGYSAAVANGTVYVGLSPDYSYIYAFNEANGQIIWRYKTADVITTPAVVGGVLYVGANYSINALNAYSGNLLWSFCTGWRVESSPTVANGIIYVGSNGCGGIPTVHFYALNATNGAQIWNYTTFDDITTSPAISGGVVYLFGGDCDGHLYALNATSGVELWNYTLSFSGSAAVANGIVYAGCCDDIFYALNATDGTSIWNFTDNPSGYGTMAATNPAVADGVVYVGPSDGKLYALNATNGQTVWSFQTQPVWNNYTYAIGGSPAVESGVIYFGAGNGCLYALNVTSGLQL